MQGYVSAAEAVCRLSKAMSAPGIGIEHHKSHAMWFIALHEGYLHVKHELFYQVNGPFIKVGSFKSGFVACGEIIGCIKIEEEIVSEHVLALTEYQIDTIGKPLRLKKRECVGG